MKRKKSGYSNLWMYFALIIFAVLPLTGIIMIVIAYGLYQTGIVPAGHENPVAPLIGLLFISVVGGVCLSMVVAMKILKPINELSKVSGEVAKGNFNIQMPYKGKIKEVKELVHNFNFMVQELSNTETLRNDFVVNVSHEFKTPISAIEGYATLLQDRTMTDEEREEYTKLIIDSSRQLATLTANILNLSKLENQEVVLERTMYRLDEQLRQAALLFEAEWSTKNLQLDIELPRTLYYGNEKLILQVWTNLIGNAIKFTPYGGTIGIQLVEGQCEVAVTITDTGCGMEESVKRHMFDKFYQGDTARKSEGYGLGLALVKRIVDLCQGSIEVNSGVDHGTAITIRLPLEQGENG